MTKQMWRNLNKGDIVGFQAISTEWRCKERYKCEPAAKFSFEMISVYKHLTCRTKRNLWSNSDGRKRRIYLVVIADQLMINPKISSWLFLRQKSLQHNGAQCNQPYFLMTFKTNPVSSSAACTLNAPIILTCLDYHFREDLKLACWNLTWKWKATE